MLSPNKIWIRVGQSWAGKGWGAFFWPRVWMEFAGMFKDDPWIDDWKKSIEEYRQKIEDDPDAL